MTSRFSWLLVLTALLLPRAVAAQNGVPEAPLSGDELSAVKAAESARIAAIESVYGSVVAIFGNDRGGGGSGVIYDSAGLALTNHHVVAGAGVEGWAGLADGKLYRWRLIGTDPGGDVAIIQLLGKDKFPVAPLGNSDTVRVGDFAMAMGNPFVLAEDLRPTVTLGLVSGIERYQPGAGENKLVYGNCIQVDSSINPGNSGGPLFNLQGEVIGINGRGSFKERGRVNVGLGYAISINQVKNFLPDLLATKMVQHGTLDAVFGNRGSEVICHTLNLDSKIADLGLQLGDKLIAFEGQTIANANQFTNLITTLPAGWPCEVTFEHAGKQSTVHVRLTPLPYGGQAPPMAAPQPMPPKKEEEKPAPQPPAEDKSEKAEPKDDEPPADDKPDDTKKPAEGAKPGDEKPMLKPARPAPPNFGVEGEVRDAAFNEENAKRLLGQNRAFTGKPTNDAVQGWAISDVLTRNDAQVGEQTMTIARDGRFAVTVSLDGKTSRFAYDGKTFWSQVNGDEVAELDAERLARNPFAAQAYVLATLQTSEPLSTIGKVRIDSADKARGELAYRLKAIDADTDEFFVWFSVLGSDGQPQVRLLKTGEAYDDERTPAVVYDDWKEVGGVQLPHQRRVVAGLAESVALTLKAQQVTALDSVAETLFKKPDHAPQNK